MARWRLIQPHYLRVPGTKWEYNEIDRITGRPKRTQFDVPQLLNPEDENDVRAFGQGPGPIETWSIIVSDGHNPGEKDVIFLEKDGKPGLPTPGMVPIDAEAKEISARFEKKWDAPTGTDGELSYAQKLEETFIKKMAELQAGVAAAPAAPGQADMMQSMLQMMAKQTEILAQLAKSNETKRKVA